MIDYMLNYLDATIFGMEPVFGQYKDREFGQSRRNMAWYDAMRAVNKGTISFDDPDTL